MLRNMKGLVPGRLASLGLLLGGVLIARASTVPEAATISTERVAQITAWLPAHPVGLGRPISDREAWQNLAKIPAFAAAVEKAGAMAQKPVPPLPPDLYLDYSRTGNRERCQNVQGARSSRVFFFTLAEALQNKGQFIQPLADTIEALCDEPTWVYPAHDGKLDNFYGRTVEADLRATAVAWELACADYILGSKLPATTRKRLRDNVERRVLQPFRDMVEGRRKPIFWLHATHNWNAVCLSGTVGAALALEESPAERAWFVAAGEHYIRYFLKSFTPDGYCSEGIGYWNYGFGHFLMMSETLRQASGGKLDLLADPQALQPALFCKRSEIINGVYPTISDVHPGSRPDAQFVCFISERFGLPAPVDCPAVLAKPNGSLAGTLLFSFLSPMPPVISHAATPADLSLRTWFNDGGVLICRPGSGTGASPFAAVLKGGNNAENHNHNDVGSFSVVQGEDMVICDPGAEVYTARTFSSHRYDSKVLSSFGHAVPVIAGKLQQTGAEAKAVVIKTDFQDDRDTLVLDLTSAYKVPDLKRLERTFVYQRVPTAQLTVSDNVSFTHEQTFETALVSWGTWKQTSANELMLTDKKGAIRVRIDTQGVPFQIHPEVLKEDLANHREPQRLGIVLMAPVKTAHVTLEISPAHL